MEYLAITFLQTHNIKLQSSGHVRKQVTNGSCREQHRHATPTWHAAHRVVVPILLQGQAGQEVQPHHALQQVMDAIDTVAVQVDVSKLVLDPMEGHQTCREEMRDTTAPGPRLSLRGAPGWSSSGTAASQGLSRGAQSGQHLHARQTERQRPHSFGGEV